MENVLKINSLDMYNMKEINESDSREIDGGVPVPLIVAGVVTVGVPTVCTVGGFICGLVDGLRGK